MIRLKEEADLDDMSTGSNVDQVFFVIGIEFVSLQKVEDTTINGLEIPRISEPDLMSIEFCFGET